MITFIDRDVKKSYSSNELPILVQNLKSKEVVDSKRVDFKQLFSNISCENSVDWGYNQDSNRELQGDSY